MGPPLPPKPPSYAKAASSSNSSSQTLVPKDPSVMEEVSAGSFFSSSSSPAPAPFPRPPILPPNDPRRPPHKPGKATRKAYVDVEDEDDELTISTAKPASHPRRGQATDKFRPPGSSEAARRVSGGTRGKGNSVRSFGGDVSHHFSSNPSGSYQGFSSSASSSSNPPARHQVSSTRSTAVDFRSPTLQPSSSQAILYPKEDEDWSGWIDDPKEEPVRQLDPPPTGGLRKGLITPKVVASDLKEGGSCGLWKDELYGFKIIDTPWTGEPDSKYMEMGSWVPLDLDSRRREGSASNADTSVEAPAEIKMDLENEYGGSDALHLAPKENGRYCTPTRQQIDSIRPHKDAFFSAATRSWVFFIPLEPTEPPSFANFNPPPGSEELLPQTELWHISSNSISARSLNITPPPSPFSLPYPSIEEFSTSLEILESTRGKRVAYSYTSQYPGVIPSDVFQRLEEKRKEPVAGETALSGFYGSVSLVWKVIDNVLFQGNPKALEINGKTFTKRFRWDEVADEIFVQVLGFHFDGDLLKPPNVNHEDVEGSVNRDRLLRCWLELGIWMEVKRKSDPKDCTGDRFGDTRIRLTLAEPTLLSHLGGDNVPRLDKKVPTWSPISSDTHVMGTVQYDGLGLTPQVADEVVIDVYYQQVFFDEAGGPNYLDCLQKITKLRTGSESLQMAVIAERSKNRYSNTDLVEAYKAIGCEGDRAASLDEDLLVSAFTERMKEVTDPAKRSMLKDALRIIASSKGSEMLRLIVSTWEEESVQMDFAKACKVLEINPNDSIAEDVLIMFFGIRVNDSPLQEASIREALKIVAEEKNLRKVTEFIKSGANGPPNEWESPSSVSLDNPIGLTNIANTCYLNSLLQYFFTVREVRETILQFVNTPTPDDGAVNEGNRVGGRLVTKKEVERSKRFVLLLQGLFNQLIHASSASVTPETELAYLALVPSKDEIAKDEEKPKPIEVITIGDDEDDALMVSSPQDGASPSILGKRGSDHLDGELLDMEPMAIDLRTPPAPPGDYDMNLEDPSSTSTSPPETGTDLLRPTSRRRATKETSLSFEDLSAKEGADGVVEIGGPLVDTEMSIEVNKPPALPPRPVVPDRPAYETQVSNYMAFGRQNDVTECMDNVMFQLECALAFSSNQDNGMAASLLKKTFYGKMRQKLEFNDPTEPEPLRIKEEPFFSLLVDVAEEGRTIHDGLDRVFDDSVVDIEGKQARRTISLVDVPPILQIQLQRVQYDRKESKIFKSNAHMSFSDTISIDRYLEIDSTDEEAALRKRKTTECRRELEKARARQHDLVLHDQRVDVSQVIRDTLSHLSGCHDLLGGDLMTPETADNSAAERADWEEETATLRKRIEILRTEIEELWADQKNATFELVAVFIHRGTALSGHYYIYQRDSKKPQRWLKYNDSLVTEIDAQEAIFRATNGDTNPYFLVYCRKDRLDAIESICRV